jgi:hypothetical protein
MNKDTTTEKLIDISISLSSEIDLNKLLEKIVYALKGKIIRYSSRMRFQSMIPVSPGMSHLLGLP